MDAVLNVFFLLGLWVIAYIDWHKSIIPDAITSFFWLLMLISGTPAQFALVASVFGALFCLNQFVILVSGYFLPEGQFRQLFGWGDILLLPMLFFFIGDIAVAISIFLLAVLLGELYILKSGKKTVPYTPFLAICYTAYLLFCLVRIADVGLESIVKGKCQAHHR